MTTVGDILKYIETLAPRSMKMDWDNVGLNCGRRTQPVTRILVALDPFSHVCQEAKEFGADLLVTHHALIWKPGFITDADNQGRNTLYLIENGIAHINAHTNLDCAPGGVNDVLAKKLALVNVQVVDPVGTDENGSPYVKGHGLARYAFKVTEKLDLGTFVLYIAQCTEAVVLNSGLALTLDDHRNKGNTVPAAAAVVRSLEEVTSWKCTICGYIAYKDELPEGYKCPICKAGVDKFVKQ